MKSNAYFELKARSHKVLSLRLLKGDTTTILSSLRTHLGKPGQLFRDNLLVFDLSTLEDPYTQVNFDSLCGLLSEYGLIPFGVHGGNHKHKKDAAEFGLQQVPASIAGAGQSIAPPTAEPPEEPKPEPKTEKHPPEPSGDPGNKVVHKTVHSGQRIVAPGDLTIMAGVNYGAEVIAGGSIHIYGSLRGRALAGGKDNPVACIFSLDFKPELVAIAGEYLVNDEIDPSAFGTTSVVTLGEKGLSINKIGLFSPEHEASI